MHTQLHTCTCPILNHLTLLLDSEHVRIVSILCCCPFYPYLCPVHGDDGCDDGVSAFLHSCTTGASVCTRGGMLMQARLFCCNGYHCVSLCMYVCVCVLFCACASMYACVCVVRTMLVPTPCMYLHQIATCSRRRETFAKIGILTY